MWKRLLRRLLALSLRRSTKQSIHDAQECPKVAFLGTRLGMQSLWVFGFIRLSDEVISRDQFDFFDIPGRKNNFFWLARGLNRLLLKCEK